MCKAGTFCDLRIPKTRGTFRVRLMLASVLLVSTGISFFRVAAEEARPSGRGVPRKALAILVGVESYSWLGNIQWCHNDVKLVEKTLLQYCACGEIVVMIGDSQEKFKPTFGNILTVLDTRLKLADQEKYDRIIIYFAGHGIRDGDGRLYFAPQDASENLIGQTGISVARVREMLDKCLNIDEKILILDTCHAGSRRGGSEGVSGRELAGGLEGTRRLFTLASCGPDEQSHPWNEKEQGLFTYWLCKGLAGDADRNPGDGRVDTAELEAFVAENVKRTSTLDLGKSQNPVAIYSEGQPWKADLAFLPDKVKEPERQAKVDAMLVDAEKYRLGGNYADAIDQINTALGVDPAHPESFALRGMVHLDRGKSRGETVDPDLAFVHFQAAIDDFDRALAYAEDLLIAKELRASWYSKRCSARYRLGDYKGALEDAGKVIELEPASPQAYLNRAKIYRADGQVEKAKQDEQAAREWGAQDVSRETSDP